MAECSEIEAGGEIRTVKDATARQGVATNAAAIEELAASLTPETIDTALTINSALSGVQVTDNRVFKFYKLGILDIFLYSGNNLFTNGILLGTLKEEVRPKVNVTFNCTAAPRYSTHIPAFVTIATNGNVTLGLQGHSSSAGEVAIRMSPYQLTD